MGKFTRHTGFHTSNGNQRFIKTYWGMAVVNLRKIQRGSKFLFLAQTDFVEIMYP